MNCLDLSIGLETEGTSGLSLISLPGISIDNFAALKDKASDSNYSLWETIQKRAKMKFATACMSRINECYKLNDAAVIACLICEKSTLFATSYWYLLGIETMIERLFSDRVNRFTTLDRQEAAELQGYYQNEFERELSLAIGGLSPHDSDCVDSCVECTGSIRFVETSL